MHIREMTASFGKLQQAHLTLEPGLNCLYAPNESGKSTWSHFLRVMLYGLATRDRGPMADKTRFLPWSGAPMAGQLSLMTDNGQAYTLSRSTKRQTAPLGEFSCTYSGTATPVDGITALNAGEMLLGIPQEVFTRSAFIRQSALAVEQDAELERRIASLITTGEEDTSYSESYDRLKKQLNSRRFNKHGVIPQLESEIVLLRDHLSHWDDLSAQLQAAQLQLSEAQRQLTALRAQQKQWQQWSQQEALRKYRLAQQDAQAAVQKVSLLSQLAGPLPVNEQLSAMEGQLSALRCTQVQYNAAKAAADAATGDAKTAETACREHSLFPADDDALHAQLQSLQPPREPSRILRLLPVLMAVLCCICGYVALAVNRALLPFLIAAGVLTLAAVVWYVVVQRRYRAARDSVIQQRAKLQAQMAEYLPLRQVYEAADATAARASIACEALLRQTDTASAALLSALRVYRPDLQGIAAAQEALHAMRGQLNTLSAAQQTARDASMRETLLREQLPDEPAAMEADVPQPETPRDTVESLLVSAQLSAQTSQSQLDTLTGQLRSCGERADLAAELAQKQTLLQAAQTEYDAIGLAMEVLSAANTQLQNRFSPALGARAADIFAAITHGRYQKVLLSRDLSIEAETTTDPVGRSVQLLSQGTADQLYLAVRLAICDLVLPQDISVPLILDDAFLSFDDDRLHAALDYLVAEGARRQILLFSCQRRETEYLRGLKNVHTAQL